jgi:hypothetical protein
VDPKEHIKTPKKEIYFLAKNGKNLAISKGEKPIFNTFILE